jgi:hypothetical protein
MLPHTQVLHRVLGLAHVAGQLIVAERVGATLTDRAKMSKSRPLE